jgi:hypothetical protein
MLMQAKTILCAAAIAAVLASTATADTWNKKTRVTFSAAVQVPGASLPAGTYVFRLLDSQSNRHIVQVVNPRENHVYATILAIPDYRLNATSKTVMYFSETPRGGGPVPLKSWFYPGDNFGQRFIYPKAKAIEIATATSQSVPAYDTPTPPKADAAPEEVLRTTEKVVIVQPSKTETPYQVAQLEKQDAQDTAGVDGQAVRESSPATTADAAAPAPQRLPKSSSPIFLMTGLGGLLLGASAASRYLRSRLR